LCCCAHNVLHEIAHTRRFTCGSSGILFHSPGLSTEPDPPWILPTLHHGEARTLSLSGVRRQKLFSSSRLGLGDGHTRRRLQINGSDPPFDGAACLSQSELHRDHGPEPVHVSIRLHRRTGPDVFQPAGSRAPSRISFARRLSSPRRLLGTGAKRKSRNRAQESLSRIFAAAPASEARDLSHVFRYR